jgi:ubiquinone/menaquinone biosynthesis C-methylase UbiE
MTKKMVKKIKERAKLEELDEKIEPVLADMQYLPFKEKQFDGILNMHNLWYVPNYNGACCEMLRVCKETLVLDCINLFNPRNFTHWFVHLFKLLTLNICKKGATPLYYHTPKKIFSPFTGLCVKVLSINPSRICVTSKASSSRFLLYVKTNPAKFRDL